MVVGRVLPVGEKPLAHAGKAEREDVVPVGRAVGIVLPHDPAPDLRAGDDLLPESRRVGGVHLCGAGRQDLPKERMAAMERPRRKGGEPVVRRYANRRTVAAERKELGLGGLPRLVAARCHNLAPTRENAVRVQSSAFVRDVRTPVALQVRQIVRKGVSGRRPRQRPQCKKRHCEAQPSAKTSAVYFTCH